jgi:hypothetical protein
MFQSFDNNDDADAAVLARSRRALLLQYKK